MARNQKPIQEVSQPDSGGNIILQEFKRSPLAYVTRAVVILLSFLFLWLAVQLAPLLRDLALIQQKVEAQEVQIIPRGEIEKQFELTNARLDRIENKLDRLVERPSGSTTNSTTTTTNRTDNQGSPNINVQTPSPSVPPPLPTPSPTEGVLDVVKGVLP